MKLKSFYKIDPEDWRWVNASQTIKSNQEKALNNPKNVYEEHVRQWVANELIETYNYSEELISPEVEVKIRKKEQPRFADLVVYRTTEKKLPYIVVETKAPGQEGAKIQGQRYTSILRAVYCLWTDGDMGNTGVSIQVGRYPEKAKMISDIPSAGKEFKPEIENLREFKSKKEISDIFKSCHNSIRNNDGLDPIKAFEEIAKLMLVKIFDERRTPTDENYKFQRLLMNETEEDKFKQESTNETAQRVRALFDKAIEYYDSDNGIFGDNEEIDLSNTSITEIVTKLQSYTLTETELDLKGRAFEVFVRGSLRKNLGIYLTPPGIVKLCIESLQIDEDSKLLDPACGTGSFLLEALRESKKSTKDRYGGRLNKKELQRKLFEWSQDNIWGVDINPRLVKTTKLNMLIHEDGRGNIYQADSLSSFDNLPRGLEKNKFQIIVTNPPFGSYINKENPVFEDYKTSYKRNGELRDRQLTQILFIERGLELLENKGEMAIVIPDSVLNNITESSIYKLLENEAEIKAIISLPPETFAPSGVTNKTSVLFLKKVKNPRQSYNIFLSVIKNVGYDATYREKEGNELPKVIPKLKSFFEGQDFDIEPKRLGFIKNFKDLGDNLCPTAHTPKQGSSGGYEKVELENLCEEIVKGKSPSGRSSFLEEPGIPVVKVGNLTDQGIDWRPRDRQYCSESFFEKHPIQQLEVGDILFTKDAHRREYIAAKIDIVDWIPEQYGERAIGGAELMVLRPNKEKIDPYYLLLYLKTEKTREKIRQNIRGQTAHVYPSDIKDLKVPLPPEEKQDQIEEAIKRLKETLNHWRNYMVSTDTYSEIFPF